MEKPMKIGPTKHLVAATFACLLWAMTAQAQQVPIPRSAAEVPGPVAGTAMKKEYVQMVGRMAYIWGWPLVNSHNRRAAFAKVSSSGLNGLVLPMAPVGQNAMLTESAPLIVDTDMGTDDWMAILILLRSPKVDVKAITVTGAGLTRIEAGTKNALNLLSLAAHKTIPVGKGGSTPLRGSHSFPEKWRESTDTMPGPTLRPNQNIPASKTAIDTIISVIEESPEKVTVLALGPLTNVAAALLKKPSIKSKLHMIYVINDKKN